MRIYACVQDLHYKAERAPGFDLQCVPTSKYAGGLDGQSSIDVGEGCIR